jgi:DNA replication protein DnaC
MSDEKHHVGDLSEWAAALPKDEDMAQLHWSVDDVGFTLLTGTCETHGEESYSTHPNVKVWRCSKCAIETVKAASQAEYAASVYDDRLKRSGVSARHLKGAFSAATAEQKTARMEAKKFLDKVKAKTGWLPLVFTGPCGTGKTLLASEIMKALMTTNEITCFYTTAANMLSYIKSGYGQKERSEYEDLKKIAAYGLLVIDELDQIKTSTHDVGMLQNIINTRYNDDKPLIVISNKLFSDFQEVIGERTVSRLYENGVVINFDWQDNRKTIDL